MCSMKIFFLFVSVNFILSFSVFADYSYEDIAVLKKYGTIKTGENNEYSIISIIGHWSDNVGSFGKTECYGKLESEKKKLFYLRLYAKESLKMVIL